MAFSLLFSLSLYSNSVSLFCTYFNIHLTCSTYTLWKKLTVLFSWFQSKINISLTFTRLFSMHPLDIRLSSGNYKTVNMCEREAESEEKKVRTHTHVVPERRTASQPSKHTVRSFSLSFLLRLLLQLLMH